jgi:hypothetical protein
MFKKLVKLSLNILLNQGIKKTKISDVAVQLDQGEGTYLLGVGATLVIETKKVLTPRERLRKRLITLFLVSFLFMIALSTIGLLIPDAVIGRWLVLISEFPAFVSALASTRLFVRKSKKKPIGEPVPNAIVLPG